MNKQEISQLMAMLALEYSGRFEVNEERVEMWHATIGNFEYHEGQKALMEAVKVSGNFPPNVGLVHQACVEQRAATRRRIVMLAQPPKSRGLPPQEDVKKIEEGRKMLRDFLSTVKVKEVQ